MSTLQGAAEACQAVLSAPSQDPGHQGRIGGAGNLGIGKGNISPEGRIFQIAPACDRLRPHQLGIIDEHHRQGGEGRPIAALGLKPIPDLIGFPADVRGKAVPVGFQTLHAAAEHHVCPGRVLFLFDLLEQLIGAAGDHLHPDAGALLEFPDDGGVDLLLVGGVDHQPPALRRSAGKGLLAGSPAAGKQQKKGQKNDKLFFHTVCLRFERIRPKREALLRGVLPKRAGGSRLAQLSIVNGYSIGLPK